MQNDIKKNLITIGEEEKKQQISRMFGKIFTDFVSETLKNEIIKIKDR